MPTQVCVPILVHDVDRALADAREAGPNGADLVEYRIDGLIGDEDDASDPMRRTDLGRLLDETPLPSILTCRAGDEGGGYEGADGPRAELLEHLCALHRAPAYLDVEQAAMARSPELRAEVGRCVGEHGARLLLSIHGVEGRPEDLERRLLRAFDEPLCAVVKVAHLARSVRDNLELFDLLGRSPKPMIALGMGPYGLASRVLAPKFGGFLTFASLRPSSTTAPGQPTLEELLGMYRFRSIGRGTRVYGVIGWPVGHSQGPLVHNAGFDAVGWDGVYLPLPVPDSDESFRATVGALFGHGALGFEGASVTIPHKERAARAAILSPDAGREDGERSDERPADEASAWLGAANTLGLRRRADGGAELWRSNTDASAIGESLVRALLGLGDRDPAPGDRLEGNVVGVVGAGGVARAAVYALASRGAEVVIFNRTVSRARAVVEAMRAVRSSSGGDAVGPGGADPGAWGRVSAASLEDLVGSGCDAYVNGTPIGMAGGPDPEGLSIPIPEMSRVGADTVFFETVYTPAETPMLRAARGRGCPTIDGVSLFVRQAAAQFESWTGRAPPADLFEGLVRASG